MQQAYRLRDIERYRTRKRAASKRAYWKDPEKQRKEARDRRSLLRDEFITAYGGRCSCCAETEPAFLTLEHLNRDGKAHRNAVGDAPDSVLRDLKVRGWPHDGYALLCFNCNNARWRLGRCPHQKVAS